MEGRTYTKLWRRERKLYAIQDIRLLVPVGMSQAIAGIVAGAVWLPLWFTFDIARVMVVFGRFSPGAELVGAVGPSLIAGALVGAQLSEGRTATEWLWSAAKWTTLPRALHRMGPAPSHPDRVAVTGPTWLPTKGTR